MNSELFNSQWTDFSIANRKMVIILMSLSQKTSQVEVPPFIIINKEYFADVRKDSPDVTFPCADILFFPGNQEDLHVLHHHSQRCGLSEAHSQIIVIT